MSLPDLPIDAGLRNNRCWQEELMSVPASEDWADTAPNRNWWLIDPVTVDDATTAPRSRVAGGVMKST